MTKSNEKFNYYLEYLLNDEGPHEATIGLLKDLVRKDMELLKVVHQKFETSTNETIKEVLSMIAISVGQKQPFTNYLKEVHGWTDDDFKC